MSDTEDIATLKGKLADWKARLDGDHEHSISRQVTSLVWRSAFYRSLNESRKSLPQDDVGEPIANGTLHGFVNEGFIALQTTGIRRLLDKSKGVNSLGRLVEDIEKYASILTRANVLAVRGLPYDYTEAKERARETARIAAEANGEKAFCISGNGWGASECWHMLHDEMCVVNESSRKRDDCPTKGHFRRLREALRSSAQTAVKHVNRHVAHSTYAEPGSSIEHKEDNVTLAAIYDAELTIVRTASFLSRCVIEGSDAYNVPHPQFDLFEHLDRAFAPCEARGAMQCVWDEYAREVDECRRWSWDHL